MSDDEARFEAIDASIDMDWIAANEGECEPEYCRHCGKDYADFSDLGCGHCDRRSPDWGIRS